MPELNAAEIITKAKAFADFMLTNDLDRDNDLNLVSLMNTKNDVFNTKYANHYVSYIAVGAVTAYHDQLREVLKEKASIDIGEFEK